MASDESLYEWITRLRELDATRAVLEALAPLPQNRRLRVLAAVCEDLAIEILQSLPEKDE